jgi:hypothetical protein
MHFGKKINLYIFYLLLFCWLCSSVAQFNISKRVFSNGGGSASGLSNQIKSTIGQPLIGQSLNNSFKGLYGFWYIESFVVGITEEIENLLPIHFELIQNYPNPFNPKTKIKYAIPKITQVRIDVYNILGQHVSTLVNDQKQPGYYFVEFDASNLASGFYVYQLSAKNFVDVKKMIVTK